MSGVDIPITATDAGATSTIDSVKGSLDGLGDSAGAVTTSTASFTDTLSTSARVGDTAVLAVDRMQISQDLVTNASIRQELAQTRLSDAVQKYGANSQQAQRAQQELQIATDNVTVAHTRQEERMLSTALIAIPRMITGLKELGAAFQTNAVDAEGNAIAVEGLTSAQLANIAVATLGVGIPVALAALALVQGANVGGSTNVNLYGDYNVNAAGPVNTASTAQFAASSRP